MDELIVVLLSLTLVCVIALAILIVILIFRKPKDNQQIEILKQVGSLEKSISYLSEQIKSDIENSVLKEMNELSKQNGQNSDTMNERFRNFEERVNEKIEKSFETLKESLTKSVDGMNDKINKNVAELNEKVGKNLLEINEKVNETLVEGFKSNNSAMGDLQTKITKIDEAQKNLKELQKEVTSLNNVLSGNQSRGQYGELQLEMLLEHTFPNGKDKYYILQDDLGRVVDGNKVRADASLLFEVNGEFSKMCIDSKFPFSDYSRLYSNESINDEDRAKLKSSFKGEVRKRVDEVASKYIVPGKTIDNAVMFVPNDGVFAYIENEFQDIVTHAREEHVIIASPSTLQAIIVIFHSAAINAERNKNIEIINNALNDLGIEFNRFSVRWRELEKTLGAIDNKKEKFGKTVDKINRKFNKISRVDMIDEEEENLEIEAENEY